MGFERFRKYGIFLVFCGQMEINVICPYNPKRMYSNDVGIVIATKDVLNVGSRPL